MIPAGPVCAGCLEVLGTDRAADDVDAHGQRFTVHALRGCRRLLAEAADVDVEVEQQPDAPRPTVEQPPTPTRPGSFEPRCRPLALAGRDVWADPELQPDMSRAEASREARLRCVRSDCLLACLERHAGTWWAPHITVAGWTSPSLGRARNRVPLLLSDILEQHARDREAERRAQIGRRKRPVTCDDAETISA